MRCSNPSCRMLSMAFDRHQLQFVQIFQDAQEDLERREKNATKRRTMIMWKNALDEQWKTRPIKATRKTIDRQPKIMRAIIEADGGRTPY